MILKEANRIGNTTKSMKKKKGFVEKSGRKKKRRG